ncbi:MAG: S1/P1 nuclease [Bacteroidales bacterium]|nr:S1/P1 nuclease [Bacteroidales bacterium]
MKSIKSLFLIGLLLLSFSLSAYDGVGHRIVASIAYQNLTEKTRTQVDAVLGKRGIIYEATWADEIRSDKKYDYSYPWHYQNLRDSMTTNDLKTLLDNPKSDGEHLFYAIDLMKSRLKKDKTDAEALKFLVHFVADLHQPMHLGRKDDLGGNKVETKWFGKTINLHSLWDGYMIENQKLSYSEFSQYLQDKFEPKKAEFKKFSVIQSVEAGYEVRTQIYGYDNSDTNNYHYVYRFADSLDEMLYRGGIQLANILNAIYK